MWSRPLFDLVALLARIGVGGIFIAHGWQKIQVGVTATSANLDRMGAPLPDAAAVFATFVELLGGIALIVGAALPLVGLLLFADMAGAFVIVHWDQGIFVSDGGFELVLVLGLASLLLGFGGSGRYSVDAMVLGWRHATATDPAGEQSRNGAQPSTNGGQQPAGVRQTATGSDAGRTSRVDPRGSGRTPDTTTGNDVLVAGTRTEGTGGSSDEPRRRTTKSAGDDQPSEPGDSSKGHGTGGTGTTDRHSSTSQDTTDRGFPSEDR